MIEKSMVWFVSLWLLFAAPTRWPVKSLTVEGNHNYTKEQVLRVAAIRLGQLAGKQEFEAARDRLVATGAFETVGYRFTPAADRKGYAASFQVVEVEPVYPVRFEELDVPDADLDAGLKKYNPLYGPKIPATSPVLQQYAKSIEAILAGKNKSQKVLGKVVASGPGEFKIVFRPATAPPRVAQVNFEGNQVLSSEVLRKAISAVAIGTAYSESGFRLLLENSVRPVYEARGRIRVSFPKITAEKAEQVNGVVVTVRVDEGVSYELGDVQITGSTAVQSAELLKVADFKTGDLANFDDVAKGVERIRKRMHRQGYLRAEVQVERKIDPKRKTVDLTLHVDEGPQFVFGKLAIAGLDIHGEAAIRKLWTLKEGKPFNADYPDYFLNRVREENIFENLGKTRSEINLNEQTHMVDVTLHFG